MTNEPSGEQVLAAWQRYSDDAATGAKTGSIRPVTLQSWDRCRDLGIDPTQIEYKFLTPAELQERKRANAELLEVARPYMEHLSVAVGSKPHVVALSDSEGWILELAGDPEAFGGRSTGIWWGSSWAEDTIGNNGIGTALACGEPVIVFGVEHFVHAFHPASCLGVPIRRNGEIIGALDISVLNRDADPERLTLAQACVRSIETALRQLADGSTDRRTQASIDAPLTVLTSVIHDVKQPLSAMRATTQLGVRNAHSDRDRKYFEMLMRQIDRLTETLDRVGTEPSHERYSNESVNGLVRDVVENVSSACHVASIGLQYRVHGDSMIHVQPGLFSRVILNILINSIQAMDEGGTLSIDVAERAGVVRIEIADTGPGIPSNVRPHVFEPYVSGREDGSGLGLYTVHEAVTERFGGRVWFDTLEGVGTTFYIEIPVAATCDRDSQP